MQNERSVYEVQLAADIAERVNARIPYPIDHVRAARLVEAALPLWGELEDLGWTDGHGGIEFRRVFAAALVLIHQEANLPLGQSVLFDDEPEDAA